MNETDLTEEEAIGMTGFKCNLSVVRVVYSSLILLIFNIFNLFYGLQTRGDRTHRFPVIISEK